MDVFLQPGEVFVGDEGYRMRTLLGSCVSITLWHPQQRVGAMSHFLLASRGTPHTAEPDGRYGDEALQIMLNELNRTRVEPRQCEAKIFGGGNMFPEQSRPKVIEVGRRNGSVARELLSSAGIPVVAECLYGVGHRQIIFDVAQGHVWSRQIRPAAANAANKVASMEAVS
jgi:chemotaxis protein CheD